MFTNCVSGATPGIVNEWGNMSVGLTNKAYIIADGGNAFSLALNTNGTIIGWGSNAQGQLDIPPGTNYADISAGSYHGLALHTDGSLIAWGGQEGDIEAGLTNCPLGTNYIGIAAGGDFNLALKQDKSIVAWGNGDFGQTNIPQGFNYKKIAAGLSHGMALKIDGSIVVWGADDAPDIQALLTNVPPGKDFFEITAGSEHCVALHSDGTPEAWGSNGRGQLNYPSNEKYFDIAAGNYHNIAIRLDGILSGWGKNNSGQIDCPIGNTFLSTGAGGDHSLAVNFSDLSCLILADRTKGLYTLPVQFVAATSGDDSTNIYYKWDFNNDGVIDFQGWNESTPTNLYTTGLYSVMLEISNKLGDTAYNFRTDFIEVFDSGVVADFKANILTGSIPSTVRFTDISSNEPQYWFWDFDSSGNIDSYAPNPTYTFSTAGTYSVTLMVSNNFGEGSGASSDIITKQKYIVVLPLVVADFTVNKSYAYLGETINFTDNSKNNPEFWSWDFDNNGVIDSTNRDPVYSYSSSGYKTVKLIAGNIYSSDTNVKTRLITIPTTNQTLYVSKYGAEIDDFNSWSNAAVNIQDAIGLALDNAEILVSNGVYSSEGFEANGSNVFVITNNITLIGCGDVTIDGRNIMRCGYVASGEVNSFTFINGNSSGTFPFGAGGGIFCSDGAEISRCYFLTNTAVEGGGAYIENSSLISCLFARNSAQNGGGMSLGNDASIYNCTVADNTAGNNGGGLYSDASNDIWNTILYDNYSVNGSNYFISTGSEIQYSCIIPELPSGGTGNIYDDPLFVNGYMIDDLSPCINAGYTFYWMDDEKDIVGSNRVNFGNVDIGAYESAVPEPALFIFTISILCLLLKVTKFSSNP